MTSLGTALPAEMARVRDGNRLKDLTGQSFGRLVVVSRSMTKKSSLAMWLCRCECGNEAIVDGCSLRRAHTKSCGCLRDETRLRFTHGMSDRREYTVWCGIKERCQNPKNPSYPRYGGRGIRMHEPWSASFETFLADVGDRPTNGHSIDRVDNDRGYEPGNVRWATRSEQVRNSSKFKGGNSQHSTKAEMSEDIIRLERQNAQKDARILVLEQQIAAVVATEGDVVEMLRVYQSLKETE